jgi:integrase
MTLYYSPISVMSLRMAYDQVLEKTGINDFHDLHHTFATRLVRYAHHYPERYCLSYARQYRSTNILNPKQIRNSNVQMARTF